MLSKFYYLERILQGNPHIMYLPDFANTFDSHHICQNKKKVRLELPLIGFTTHYNKLPDHPGILKLSLIPTISVPLLLKYPI